MPGFFLSFLLFLKQGLSALAVLEPAVSPHYTGIKGVHHHAQLDAFITNGMWGYRDAQWFGALAGF